MILPLNLNALDIRQMYKVIIDTVAKVSQSICFISKHFVKKVKASEQSL